MKKIFKPQIKSTSKIQSAVLATLIGNPHYYDYVRDHLYSHFFKDQRDLAEYIFDCIQKSAEIDPTIIETLVGPDFYMDLITRGTNLETFKGHCKILCDFWMNEELESLLESVDEMRKNGSDFSEAVSHLRNSLDLIEDQISKRSDKLNTLSGVTEDFFKLIEAEDGITGVQTAYQSLTRYNKGWNPGYHIIAGRPGHGKTTVMMEQALAAAESGVKTIFYSFGDLSSRFLFTKMAFTIAGIDGKDIKRVQKEGKNSAFGKEISQKFSDAVQLIGDLPIDVRDVQEISNNVDILVPEMIADYRRGFRFFCLDYIQQLGLTKESDNTNTNLESISKKLQWFCKRCDVPLLVGSQLNRGVETNGGSKRPSSSHMRGSGALEQDADSIWFVYRAEKYGILEDENGLSLKGVTEFFNDKMRDVLVEAGRSFMLKYYEGRLHDPEQAIDMEEFDDMPDFSAPLPPITRPAKMNDDEDIPF